MFMNVLTSHTAISSTRSSLLPYLGKSPSVLKSTIKPSASRIGVTFAYLIADKESTAHERPATPVAKKRPTLVSCKAISRASYEYLSCI